MTEQSDLEKTNDSAAVKALDAARANPAKNVSHIPLHSIAPKPAEGVETAYNHALRRASEAVVWYQRAKDRKKGPAIALRFLAIVVGGLGTIMPIVVSMLSDPLGKRLLPSASMFAAIAVGCVALDKLFGFSLGWMRYMGAMLELQEKIESFEFAWARERLKRVNSSPTPESQAADLDMIAAFVSSISGVIRSETQAWAGEFKTVLAGQETAVEAQRNATSIVARRRGALSSQRPRRRNSPHPRHREKKRNQRACGRRRDHQGRRNYNSNSVVRIVPLRERVACPDARSLSGQCRPEAFRISEKFADRMGRDAPVSPRGRRT